jgi:hypothetical protein
LRATALRFLGAATSAAFMLAWLLGDTERIAAFLRISRGKVPADPESLDHARFKVPIVINQSVNLALDGPQVAQHEVDCAPISVGHLLAY